MANGAASRMTWTPGGAPTSSTTWTISVWVKKVSIGEEAWIATEDSGGEVTWNNGTRIYFNSSDQLRWYEDVAGTVDADLVTNRVFRDPAAWYHLVFKWDTTNGTPGDRMKIFVNGVEETSFATDNNPDSSRASVWGTQYYSSIGQKVATEEVAATDEKSMLARKIREGVAPRKNPDGTESTVLMVTQESDGKFYAHPSLFPDGKGGWIQFGKSKEDMDKAWNMAKDKGELFEFDDEGEAENFAKGSWKSKGTGLDVILDAYSDIKSGKTPPKPPELKEKDKEYDWSFLPPDPEKFKEADWEYSPPATADEWSKSVHESHKYWENQQKMWEQAMPDFADTFNLVENAGDRLEFMDRMMKLKPDERMELLKSVESSATSKEEKRALLDKYGIDERYWDYSNLDKVIVREKERRRGGLLGLKKEKYLQRTSPEEEMEDWDRNIRVLISKQEEELGRELSNEERKSLIEEVYSGRNMEEPPSVYASDDYIHELSRRKELMERLGIDEKYTGMFEHEVNKIDISELIKKAYTPSGLWRMGKGYGQWIIPGGKGKHDVKGFYPEDRGQLRFKEAYRGIETDITGAKTLGDVDPRTGRPYPVGTAGTPRKRLGYEDWLEELYGKYYDPGI